MPSSLSYNSKHSQHNMSRNSGQWNCIPCTTPNINFASFEDIYLSTTGIPDPASGRCVFTTSQAMKQAMAMAAEYMRVAEQYPMLTFTEPDIAPLSHTTNISSTIANSRKSPSSSNSSLLSENNSDIRSSGAYSSRTADSTFQELGGLGLSIKAMETVLANPIKSTRSNKARPRTVSTSNNSATLCGSPHVNIDSSFDGSHPTQKSPRLAKFKNSFRRHRQRVRSIWT
ncbi:hypothetical protein COEREDRAFT_87479 [Coemansia reversa NRRL 1564]|uniref:Uncharacterized protein n=1 Tax=Coemansia reversa (strain ATCC 12441 / NRRL 1564) TaxID=763665 RepID=A0A2G5BAH2_COERN|nr:hypothetical protein COEREDRAFT_87479 [Coemansia reversa NRRL 1564]|eukprot:PIA15992.1 hypothetical protein COEREDRAFT_87479 [Coemansia reversa NRRL 1564]